jgi:hypothetical protein
MDSAMCSVGSACPSVSLSAYENLKVPTVLLDSAGMRRTIQLQRKTQDSGRAWRLFSINGIGDFLGMLSFWICRIKLINTCQNGPSVFSYRGLLRLPWQVSLCFVYWVYHFGISFCFWKKNRFLFVIPYIFQIWIFMRINIYLLRNIYLYCFSLIIVQWRFKRTLNFEITKMWSNELHFGWFISQNARLKVL